MTNLAALILAAVTGTTIALPAACSAAGNSKEVTQMETVDLGKEFLGKTIDHAMQELGTPVAEDRFELGLSVLEFRIELTNLFDETRRAENPPDIREATWAVSPEENLTLWFTRSEEGQDWQVIHFFAWHPDSQF